MNSMMNEVATSGLPRQLSDIKHANRFTCPNRSSRRECEERISARDTFVWQKRNARRLIASYRRGARE